MRVADLMTRSAVSCKSSDKLSLPASLMWECDCGAIPVLDEGGAVKGMITDRDICMACFTRDRAPSSIPVKEAMSHTLYFCSPGSSVADAEAVMRNHRVRRLPVLDDQQHLVGILSLADIAREAERERSQGRKEIAPEEVTDVLGDICQPGQSIPAAAH
jgi:CBS domain-containing protein